MNGDPFPPLMSQADIDVWDQYVARFNEQPPVSELLGTREYLVERLRRALAEGKPARAEVPEGALV